MKIKQKKRPRIKPYSFEIKNHTSEEILKIYSWIFIELGPYDKKRIEFRHGWNWGAEGNSTVYFENKEDAMAFKLRWL